MSGAGGELFDGPTARTITAATILELLSVRHSKDVFVPECKSGPTWGAKHVRLDAWAMPRSWANFSFIGYEIKSSRADWLADRKLHFYLPLCTDLYVAAAPGAVMLDELPAEVGLLETAKTGGRLFTRRKAVHRDVTPPVELFAYILMCRSRIIGERREGPDRAERMDEARQWAEEHEEGARVGGLVAMRLGEKVRERTAAAEDRAAKAEGRAARLEEADRLLREYGLASESRWSLKRKLEAINRNDLGKKLLAARQAIHALEHELEDLTKLPPEEELTA